MTDSKHLLAGERIESLSFPLIENQTPAEMRECKNVWEVTQDQMRDLKLPTAEEIQQIREMAHKEGHEAGEKAGLASGLAAGQKRIDQAVARVNGVLNQLAQPLAEQPDRISLQLTELLCQMLVALLNRELALDSSGVVSVVQDALAGIEHGALRVQVRLNPQDLKLWQTAGAQSESPETVGENRQGQDEIAIPPLDERVTLVADASVNPGGCLVDTEACQVDGTIETRLKQVIERLYHGLALGADEAASGTGGAP